MGTKIPLSFDIPRPAYIHMRVYEGASCADEESDLNAVLHAVTLTVYSDNRFRALTV